MLKSQRAISIMLVLCMLCGMLFGCAQDGTNSAEGTQQPEAVTPQPEGPAADGTGALEPANLRFWTFLDPVTGGNPRADLLADLIREFEEANPGVTVTVETQEWTTLTSKVIAAHAAGNAPDIFMASALDLGSVIEAGCYEPLENLFYDDWTQEQKDDVDNPIWQSGFDGTYHYQVPLFYGVFGIYYRSDLFEKFGIKAEDIETWDDLVEAAQKLTYADENGNQVWGLGIGYNTEVSDAHGRLPAALFHQGMFTEDGYPNNWSGEAGVEALQWQLDLIDKYQVMPSSCMSITSEELYNQFEAGQYAMIFGGSIRVPTVRSLSSFDPNDVQFMKFPANTPGEGSTTSVMGGWHCGVWSNSPYKEQAGAFLEMLASPETDIRWVTEADQMPLHAKAEESFSDVFSKPENQYLVTCMDIVANSGVMQPTKFTITQYLYYLQNAVIRAYVDGLTPEEALKEAEEGFIQTNRAR